MIPLPAPVNAVQRRRGLWTGDRDAPLQPPNYSGRLDHVRETFDKRPMHRPPAHTAGNACCRISFPS